MRAHAAHLHSEVSVGHYEREVAADSHVAGAAVGRDLGDAAHSGEEGEGEWRVCHQAGSSILHIYQIGCIGWCAMGIRENRSWGLDLLVR